MTDIADALPDVLETLGLQITEVGAVQVGSEKATRAASGSGRVMVVLQSAWSGPLAVDLTVKLGDASLTTRRVDLAHGEVRRVRLPLQLPESATGLVVGVAAPVPSGSKRIRSPWLKDDERAAPDSSVWGALVGALKQAVGRGGVDAPAAKAERQIAVAVEPSPSELAVAAEDEAVWQVGMAPPPETYVSARPASELVAGRVVEPPPSVEPAPRAEKLTCLHCNGSSFRELVTSRQQCPLCGQPWSV